MFSAIVVDSTGTAADWQGGILGEYIYDSTNGHYVQANTENKHENYEPKYLYRNEDYEEWLIGQSCNEDLRRRSAL